MRVKLTHPSSKEPFVAVSQRQIDRLTAPDREGGPWTVVATGSDALAESHKRDELVAMAEAAGVEVPAKATKKEIAALIETGGASAATDPEV